MGSAARTSGRSDRAAWRRPGRTGPSPGRARRQVPVPHAASRCAHLRRSWVGRASEWGLAVENPGRRGTEAMGTFDPIKSPDASQDASACQTRTWPGFPRLFHKAVGVRRPHSSLSHIVERNCDSAAHRLRSCEIGMQGGGEKNFCSVETIGPVLAICRPSQPTRTGAGMRGARQGAFFDKQALTNGQDHRSQAEWRRCRATGPGSVVASQPRGMDRRPSPHAWRQA